MLMLTLVPLRRCVVWTVDNTENHAHRYLVVIVVTRIKELRIMVIMVDCDARTSQ